jgi:hypothetical protein
LHFDGTSWKKMDVPANDSNHGPINQIWGTSNKNVYAVGGDRVIHYDGERWSVVSTPEITLWTSMSVLGGSGPNDVYALAGFTGIHFDGKRWSVLRSSNDSEMLSQLYVEGIWCGAKNDVILVGHHEAEDAVGGDYLHFDGAKWHEVDPGHEDMMSGVAGRDRAHLYAVGKRIYRMANGRWVPDSHPGAPKDDVVLSDIAACGDCVVAVGGDSLVLLLCE